MKTRELNQNMEIDSVEEAEEILKAAGTEDLFEKAHYHGEIHKNGKWYWNSQAAGGKGDWRVIKKQGEDKTETKPKEVSVNNITKIEKEPAKLEPKKIDKIEESVIPPFEIKAANRNVSFLIKPEQYIGPFNSYLSFKFGSDRYPVKFQIKDGKKTMYVNPLNKDLKNYIEKNFNQKISKNKDTFVVLSDDSWNKIEEIQKQFEKNKQKYYEDLAERAKKMPLHYFMHENLDWGDYITNLEHDIIVYRDALPEEKKLGRDKIEVNRYSLWNRDIDDFKDEWLKDLKKIGLSSGKVEIDEKLAKKWINNWKKLQDKKEQEKKAKEEKAKEKKAKEEKRIKQCFEEAKRTGKPVKLYSYFLSGNDIPKKYRDEDSDMGDLVVYAMPDGTKKEKFFHAY